MNQRLRGNHNYTFDDLMEYCGKVKDVWISLESMLEEDYYLDKLLIKDSKVEGWGVNYRAKEKSLCYIHPEKDSIVVVFQIREDRFMRISNELSEYALKVWENKYPCGKGGWIWYRLKSRDQIEEVHKLLNAKITPNKK